MFQCLKNGKGDDLDDIWNRVHCSRWLLRIVFWVSFQCDCNEDYGGMLLVNPGKSMVRTTV